MLQQYCPSHILGKHTTQHKCYLQSVMTFIKDHKILAIAWACASPPLNPISAAESPFCLSISFSTTNHPGAFLPLNPPNPKPKFQNLEP